MPDGSTSSGMPGNSLARLEDEDTAFARLDRQVQARQRRHLAGVRAGGVDDDAGAPARSPLSSVTPVTSPASVAVDTGDRGGDEADPFFPQRLAEEHQQRMGIEPAFARPAPRPGNNAFWWTARGTAAASASRAFSRISAPSAACASWLAFSTGRPSSLGEDQIALLVEGDVGIRAEFLLQPAGNRPSVNCERRMFSGIENCWRIEAHDSVVAECVNCGLRSTSAMEPAKSFLAQIEGDRTSDDRSADDDDVVSRHDLPIFLFPRLYQAASTPHGKLCKGQAGGARRQSPCPRPPTGPTVPCSMCPLPTPRRWPRWRRLPRRGDRRP